MPRLEEQIAHGDHARNVLRIQLQALFEVVCGAFEVLLLEVDDANLAVRLVVIRVKVDGYLELLDRLRILFELVEDLSEAKMSWNRLRLKLAAVLEVFFGFLEVARVGQLRSQMDAGAEV